MHKNLLAYLKRSIAERRDINLGLSWGQARPFHSKKRSPEASFLIVIENICFNSVPVEKMIVKFIATHQLVGGSFSCSHFRWRVSVNIELFDYLSVCAIAKSR